MIAGCLRTETTYDRDQSLGHPVDIHIPINFVQEASSLIVLDEWGGLFMVNLDARPYRLGLIIITLEQFAPTQVARLHCAWRIEKDVERCLAVSTYAPAR